MKSARFYTWVRAFLGAGAEKELRTALEKGLAMMVNEKFPMSQQ